MEKKSSPTHANGFHVKVFPRPFKVTYQRIRSGRQDSPCGGWRSGSSSAADILAITGGGSNLEQVKPWSYTLPVKADPPSIIFLAFHSFKDNLDPEALMQPEDM